MKTMLARPWFHPGTMLTATPTPKSSTTSGDGNMLLVEQGGALE
ncbi:hypothetical protein [Marivita sp.]